MSSDSPGHLRSNALDHLVESNVGSGRNAVNADVVGKIVYDDPAVFRRLRVDQVNDNFVAICATSFRAANTKDIKFLMDLAAQASRKSPETLELEETTDKINDPNKDGRSGNHGSAEENMYDPLVRLFNYVANFDQAPTPRRFQKTNGTLKAHELHTFSFPSCSPDFTITSHGIDASTSRRWRDRDAFGVVKPSNKRRPKPPIAGTIPDIVAQPADYARLLMSARPFMLFCVGILILGTEFCVGIFDRDGITFSPAFDMFKDTEVFIRVARSMACNLSIVELGSDPTIRVLSDFETEKLTGRPWPYPSVVVLSGGNNLRQWCTIGPPIWASLSFLGRGTNVWRVRAYTEGVNQQPFLEGDEMVMKTAWCSSGRTPESDIYMSIDQPPEGLAKFECGGDVKFAGYPITVQNLRSHPVYSSIPEGDINSPTPVLHRLILRTVGRPIWEYTSDLDLLTGFRDALQAHKDLCDQGILHRDISAGNVLLTANQSSPLRGFITDLEFARVESSTLKKAEVTRTTLIRTQVTTRTHVTFESTVTVKRDVGMTGTAQFMARQILRGAIQAAERVVHEARHDVESFIWVLSYSVMRSLYRRASKKSAPKEVRCQCAAFRSLFRLTFGWQTPKAIADARQSESDGLIFPTDPDVRAIVANFMTKALVALFVALRILIHGAGDPLDPTPLTHDALLGAVNDTIALLS